MTKRRLLPFFGGLVCLAAAATVIGGLYLSGSPANVRLERLDAQRANDLQMLMYAIDGAYHKNGVLPLNLDALAKEPFAAIPVDPETRAPYEYIPGQKASYQLCATFSAASSESGLDPRMPQPTKPFYGNQSTEHGAGRQCFSYNALVSQLSPCASDWSCGPGNSCVSLPEQGQVCVPKGRECAAAGCADGCLIAESYPPQIRCEAPAPASAPTTTKNSCSLMKDKKTGKVDCFGCAQGVCTKAPAGWESYAPATGSVGIPYACFESERGCELAQ